MAEKKDYQNVLIALDRTGTLASTLNQLSKVQHETEDKNLQTALGNLATSIRQQFDVKKQGRLLGFNKQMSPTLTSGIEKLRQHCQAVIDSTEPQWMILARRAGWTPPASL